MTPDPETLELVCADEGLVLWMYLDTAGVVTCGKGHALFSTMAATLLPWDQPRDTVVADYLTVKRAAPGQLARAYEHLTASRLMAEQAQEIAAKDLAEHLETLLHYYPAYATFPLPARMALADMAFNLGGGFPLKWPQLTEAVMERDWKAAAGLCHRRGIGEARNVKTSALFLQAAGEGEPI